MLFGHLCISPEPHREHRARIAMSSSSDDDLPPPASGTPAWQNAVQSLARSHALSGTFSIFNTFRQLQALTHPPSPLSPPLSPSLLLPPSPTDSGEFERELEQHYVRWVNTQMQP